MIDVVVLGCAHVPHARSYAAALQRCLAARVVGVHDPDPELGRPLAEELGVPFEEDAETLLRRARPAAAVVCSATVEHRGMVELAASRGVHVLCEKPLATDAADARAAVEVCSAAGVQLHTAFVSRFYPALQQVRDLVARGEIGRVRGMVGGNRGRPPLTPRYPGWITDPTSAGGGALIDHAVHVVDAMRFVTGLEATKVLAETASLFVDTEVEDSALVSVVFADTVAASIDPSWSVMPSSSWDYDFYLRVLGERGSIALATNREALQVSGAFGSRTHALVPFEPDIDAAMIETFVRSVEAGRLLDPCASGEDGLRAVEVVRAAYDSVDRQELVAIGVERA